MLMNVAGGECRCLSLPNEGTGGWGAGHGSEGGWKCGAEPFVGNTALVETGEPDGGTRVWLPILGRSGTPTSVKCGVGLEASRK